MLIPTAEELSTIKFFEGNRDELDFTGKLFSLFLDVSRLSERLSCQRVFLNWFDRADLALGEVNNMIMALAEFNSQDCVSSLQTFFAFN